MALFPVDRSEPLLDRRRAGLAAIGHRDNMKIALVPLHVLKIFHKKRARPFPHFFPILSTSSSSAHNASALIDQIPWSILTATIPSVVDVLLLHFREVPHELIASSAMRTASATFGELGIRRRPGQGRWRRILACRKRNERAFVEIGV